jgi:hypothetical protein
VSYFELESEPELLSGARCRLAVVPDWADQKELAEQFAEFVGLLREANHDITALIVIEECALLRPRSDGVLVALATQSRHWRMPLAIVAQRATMIPPGTRSQFSSIISFRQTEPGDLDALAERIGQEKASRVSELPRKQFVAWSETDAFKEKEEKDD